MTFKYRVERFWEWYSKAAQSFYQSIEEGQCERLAPEVRAKMQELLPGLGWVFGPGVDGVGHSFTVTGEGVLDSQLRAIYWQSRAPMVPGWTFHSSRQPGPIQGKQIRIGDSIFDPIEFWLSPNLNLENEKLDLTVWHPMFDKMEERARYEVLFLFLDELLGEYGTQSWIGELHLADTRLREAISLMELPTFLDKIKVETGWKKFEPGETLALYHFEEPHTRFPRSDTIAGVTANLTLIEEYFAAEGDLEDPLEGTGAEYVFLAFDAIALPKGKESEARGVIEEALDAELRASASGRLLGGAHGIHSAYVDLLLFDGEASVDIVKRTLKNNEWQPATSLNYFAKEKRGHRITL